MIKLPTLNDRLGLFSTWLKAMLGLTPQQLHRIFSTNKRSILTTLYPTRSKLISYDTQDVPTIHYETSYEVWWENVCVWDKYAQNLSEELLEAIQKVTINGYPVSKHAGVEELFRLKLLMVKGSNLKEVTLRFVDKDLVIVDYLVGNVDYGLVFCLTEE